MGHSAGLSGIQVRSVVWRREVNAFPLGMHLSGHLASRSGSPSSCPWWRLGSLENPQMWSLSALLRCLEGSESRFLWERLESLHWHLGRSLAWCLDADFGIPVHSRSSSLWAGIGVDIQIHGLCLGLVSVAQAMCLRGSLGIFQGGKMGLLVPQLDNEGRIRGKVLECCVRRVRDWHFLTILNSTR